jgi:hypothetical protein
MVVRMEELDRSLLMSLIRLGSLSYKPSIETRSNAFSKRGTLAVIPSESKGERHQRLRQIRNLGCTEADSTQLALQLAETHRAKRLHRSVQAGEIDVDFAKLAYLCDSASEFCSVDRLPAS